MQSWSGYPVPMPLIYKIFRPDEWDALLADGQTAGAPVDLADGYIHFSTRDTLQGTLDKWFAGAGELVIATYEADALGPQLRWEESRGGLLFPHLYGPLQSLHTKRHWRVEPDAQGRYQPFP